MSWNPRGFANNLTLLYTHICSAGIICPILNQPQNARVVTYTNNRYVGAIASYSCNAGFRRQGTSTRECMQSGQWSEDEPSCVRKFHY